MTDTVIKRVRAGGQVFIVFADSKNDFSVDTNSRSDLLDGLVDEQIDGVIRAVPTHMVEGIGTELLLEEPNAKWFFEQEDISGGLAKMSGDGLRAFVHFLLNTGLHKVTDRRETVPVATKTGIRDTLVGLTGVSVDLGRWSMKSVNFSGDSSAGLPDEIVIEVGRTHSVSFGSKIKFDTSSAVERYVLIESSTILGHDGVAQVSAKFFRSDGSELDSSGTGVVAAALAARHVSAKDIPNHWRVQTASGSIAVRMFATEEGEHVSINGPAEILD